MNILDKTAKNYHNLESLIQEIAIKDTIKITIYSQPGNISIINKGRNLINCRENENTVSEQTWVVQHISMC